MANPFTLERPASGPMEIGDVRTVHAKDPKSGEVVKTLVITRTDRPYAYDLCDAYNDALASDARQRGLEYYVTDAGEVKLGDNLAFNRWNTETIERRHEHERQRNQHQGARK